MVRTPPLSRLGVGLLALLPAATVALAAVGRGPAAPGLAEVQRVTTIAPFPRGLAMVDGTLYVLCRGRVRGAGGVSAAVEDQAGTIYAVDPEVARPLGGDPADPRLRRNGRILTRPTDPPFRLWDRRSDPPESDRRTDRPYCTLRYHAPTHSFYICAFSGIDRPRTPEDPVAFSKNRSDALLRYDLRTARWHVVDAHRPEAGRRYPHHDPMRDPPPHGWLEGPDNCLPVGRWLYAVAKDNSRLVRYDLAGIAADPLAPPPAGELVLGAAIDLEGAGRVSLHGHSGLAVHDGWMYLAYRTSSVIVRFRIDEHGEPVRPIRGQLLARFDPYDRETGRSADLTDMTIDDRGRLYVVSAKPARIYRFTPDPARIFDARDERTAPWADLARLTGNAAMKSENVLYHGGWLYVTSGDGYDYQDGADGTVYRIRVPDA